DAVPGLEPLAVPRAQRQQLAEVDLVEGGEDGRRALRLDQARGDGAAELAQRLPLGVVVVRGGTPAVAVARSLCRGWRLRAPRRLRARRRLGARGRLGARRRRGRGGLRGADGLGDLPPRRGVLRLRRRGLLLRRRFLARRRRL